MKGKVSLLTSVLLSLPLAVNAGGALSVGQCNPEDGKYPFGYALNINQQAAIDLSQERCSSLSPEGNCQPAISFSGPACLAFSVEKKNCGATGWSPPLSNIPDAQDAAIAECKTKGGADADCLIAFANCSTVPHPDGIVLVPIVAAWGAWWAHDYWGGFRPRGFGGAYGGGDPHGGGGQASGGREGGQGGREGGRQGGSRESSNRGGTGHTSSGHTTASRTTGRTVSRTTTRSSVQRVSMNRGTVNRGGRHPR